MTDNQNGAVTRGGHHIGLTVPNLAATRTFLSKHLVSSRLERYQITRLYF
jgi:catechol 2,3-dioxygenase-like lactoylglutathione lyase family enzyme